MCSCHSRIRKNSITHIKDEQYEIVQQEILMDDIEDAYLHLDKTMYDFGKIRIKKTPKITIELEIENQGMLPLVILKTDVSCGCMSVDFPKLPILSKEKEKLTVTIVTKDQVGVFNKPIFIKSNAVNDVVLIRILGEIVK